jgi:transketolase
MNFDPENPKYFNRDRFVMSAGHGSALLYSTLYMAGFPIELDDLKKFRKLDSITPGHPEYNVTPGVDIDVPGVKKPVIEFTRKNLSGGVGLEFKFF